MCLCKYFRHCRGDRKWRIFCHECVALYIGLDNDPYGYRTEFQELITTAEGLASCLSI